VRVELGIREGRVAHERLQVGGDVVLPMLPSRRLTALCRLVGICSTMTALIRSILPLK
jgi:hypothetical protein